MTRVRTAILAGAAALMPAVLSSAGPVVAQPVPAAARTQAVATPADRFGALFEAVQMRRLFPDGKTFVDATPRRPDAAILRDYSRGLPWTDPALVRFIGANFTLPVAPSPPAPSAARPPVAEHIARLWPVLTRQPSLPAAGSSALALPEPYVVPGGRFREMYYWDSYFTMLGLARDGRTDLVESMIVDFGALIDRYGHIPNGTRSYYISRSQPPFFYLMLSLSKETAPAVLRRRLCQLRLEHGFWMAGDTGLAPGSASGHVVRMPDGAILNRYYDMRDTPRDESWREDVMTSREASPRPAGEVFRDLRAGAESGWDFSSRWLGDGRTLATVRTTAIVPIDLNALLYGMERTIAERCTALGDRTCAREFTSRGDLRRAAITRYLWDRDGARFADYDWRRGARTASLSAATLYPLFTGLATQAQADAVAGTVAAQLIAPGGLRTTTVTTGQQWDTPNGWAPLQWIAVSGLRRYGRREQADGIARRFIATADREYRASGRLLEKYDVEQVRPGGGGEYPLQDGFGWTNGVVRELIAGVSTTGEVDISQGPRSGETEAPQRRGARAEPQGKGGRCAEADAAADCRRAAKRSRLTCTAGSIVGAGTLRTQ